MKKCILNIAFCGILICFVWIGTLIADRQRLRDELIRIHVVANSDSPRDQQLKLQVRDAVMESIQNDLKDISDIKTASDYLKEKLPAIQDVAAKTLELFGSRETVAVTLGKECFEKTDGSTLSLPAGIYESLRIVIGSGQGENWWSVLFPEVVSSEVDEMNVLSVFSSPSFYELAEAPELRFYCLDVLGRLENIFYKG